MSEFQDNDELLHLLKQQHPEAVTYVYNLYYKSLCYFANQFTDDSTVSEDLVMDAFVSFLKKKPVFDSLTALKSYLYKAVQNSCIDMARTKKRHGKSHQKIQYLSPETVENVEQTVIVSEVLNAIYTSIGLLPEKYRNVVYLALVDGMDNEEIAKQTGLAYQTVRNHKSAGIKLLRTVLCSNNQPSAVVITLCLLYLYRHL